MTEAYVTLVTSDDYVDAALVVAHSLRRTGTTRSIVLVYTDLSDSSRFDTLVFVHLVDECFCCSSIGPPEIT